MTVQFFPLDRPFFCFWIVHFFVFEPSTFGLLDPSLRVYFLTSSPSSFLPLDRPVIFLSDCPLFLFQGRPVSQTVHFQSFGPSSLTPLDRPL